MKVIYDTKTDILTIILKDASVTESDEDLLDAYPNLKKKIYRPHYCMPPNTCAMKHSSI